MYNTTVPVIETYVFSLQDIQIFLDEATQGVMYFSLGTLFRSDSFPPEVLQAFTDEYTQLPFRVLWKYNPENMPPVPDNILFKHGCLSGTFWVISQLWIQFSMCI
jgi:hypothetical protein